MAAAPPISTPPTSGAKTWGKGRPMAAKRPAPISSGRTNLRMPSRRKTRPTITRMRIMGRFWRTTSSIRGCIERGGRFSEPGLLACLPDKKKHTARAKDLGKKEENLRTNRGKWAYTGEDGGRERPSVQWSRLSIEAERKADAEILLAKGADFGLRAGFLRAELVAGEAQHCESAFFVGAVKQLQSSVLGGKAAFAGGVDDQQNLAMKLEIGR